MNAITTPSVASGSAAYSTKDFGPLHAEVFEFLCAFHRVKRVASKDASCTTAGLVVPDHTLTNAQRHMQINRSLYKILDEVETRVAALPGTSEPVPADRSDEFFLSWSFLTWTLLSVINRLQAYTCEDSSSHSANYASGGGAPSPQHHFQEKIHTALIDLVNKAHRMQPPPSVPPNDAQFDRFYQAYVTALISLHELYTMTQQKWVFAEFENQVVLFKKQLVHCLLQQREFANSHGHVLWRQMREAQIQRMTRYGYDHKRFLEPAVSFYAHMLYNLGVLAARIQGFAYESRNNKVFLKKPDLFSPLLQMVYGMVDALLADSIICLEPSQNPILVTNNLFPMKILSLCRFTLFRDFSLQVVSEEVAQQIQQELRHKKTFNGNFDSPVPLRPTLSAALLAVKPSTGVKRNNAKASDHGGNTAHKKSDVNSKEWISIPPSFDPEHQGWAANYPHILCTTRQKDPILDARCQSGKRPVFYIHVRSEIFGFGGGFTTAHTLSLPFTISTRRNQDCQVQRMMSSYTATTFWLYGTNILDGLLIQWYDNGIEWKHFKALYAQYFAMNSEVTRTLADGDFTIMRMKMHCVECSDTPALANSSTDASTTITFRNVLCPHLHFALSKCDLRFSVWRGMLELLHLFNDQKTETKTLWEAGILQGFLEPDTVHGMLRSIPESGLVVYLSFVIGACVCFAVKSSSSDQEILDLEPLDAKRLQAKSLHDYLRDIIIAEKVEYLLDSNQKWLHVGEAMKRCQKSPYHEQSLTHAQTREVTSNAMLPGSVDVEHTVRFTAMRVAVVTCKQTAADQDPNHHQNHNHQGQPNGDTDSQRVLSALLGTQTPHEGFETKLDELMQVYRKTPKDVMDLLSQKTMLLGLQNSISSSDTNGHSIHQLQVSAAQSQGQRCEPQLAPHSQQSQLQQDQGVITFHHQTQADTLPIYFTSTAGTSSQQNGSACQNGTNNIGFLAGIDDKFDHQLQRHQLVWTSASAYPTTALPLHLNMHTVETSNKSSALTAENLTNSLINTSNNNINTTDFRMI